MAHAESAAMAKSRGLITDTERDRIAGDVEIEDAKRYQAVSRVRRRINEELPKEIEILEEHHPDLLEELREVVCGDDRRIYCPICGEEFDLPSNAVHHMAGPKTHGLSDEEIRRRVPDWWDEEQPNFYFDDEG